MLDKDIKYFRDNKRKFQELYTGKYIVIKNKTVIGTYESHTDAYQETTKNYAIGTFIIEHVK